MTTATLQESPNVDVTTVTPDKIVSILLQDGWHQVQNCSITQFAIGEGMSPPQPSRLYPALSFTDVKSNKEIVVPLSKVLAFEPSAAYRSQAKSVPSR